MFSMCNACALLPFSASHSCALTHELHSHNLFCSVLPFRISRSYFPPVIIIFFFTRSDFSTDFDVSFVCSSKAFSRWCAASVFAAAAVYRNMHFPIN